MANTGSLIGLDIGSVRTGIAFSRPPVHIASPLETVLTTDLAERLRDLVASGQVATVVIGLPRDMKGEATQQTAYVENLVSELQLSVPYAFQDEAATSIKAEEELKARKKPYAKEDVDMLAAVYILEDYMREHPEVTRV